MAGEPAEGTQASRGDSHALKAILTGDHAIAAGRQAYEAQHNGTANSHAHPASRQS